MAKAQTVYKVAGLAVGMETSDREKMRAFIKSLGQNVRFKGISASGVHSWKDGKTYLHQRTVILLGVE